MNALNWVGVDDGHGHTLVTQVKPVTPPASNHGAPTTPAIPPVVVPILPAEILARLAFVPPPLPAGVLVAAPVPALLAPPPPQLAALIQAAGFEFAPVYTAPKPDDKPIDLVVHP